MSYKFGSVVLVPFPFTDQTSIKKRPAVVVSSDRYNRQHPDVVVMAITSQSRTALLSDHRTIAGWQGAGLLKAWVIKPIVTTVETQLILKTLGKLQNQDCQTLQMLLAEIFGLP
jgi:mRNA interferase MazF